MEESRRRSIPYEDGHLSFFTYSYMRAVEINSYFCIGKV